MASADDMLIDMLGRSHAAVGEVIEDIRPAEWSTPTPCLDWTVHRLVEHLIGKNLVFTAVLAHEPLPHRGDGVAIDELASAYRDSSAALLDAFAQPGVLERTYRGPLGDATGAQRLQIRLYDLLAHGWDLGRAVGRPARLPADAVEAALVFARADGRAVRPGGGGCFGPPREVSDTAPAGNRLAAFLGRDVRTG